MAPIDKGSVLVLGTYNSTDRAFPEYFNSECQLLKAMELATSHLGIEAISSQFTAVQGCFSSTVDVCLQSHKRVIIQFRHDRFSETNQIVLGCARDFLGEKVPLIEEIKDERLNKDGIWSYYMPLLPGEAASEVLHDWDNGQCITFARSLGRICAYSFLTTPIERAAISIFDTVIPMLEKMSCLEELKNVRPIIDNLLILAPKLVDLPPFLRHPDLNDKNILVDRIGEITGLLDWEDAGPPYYQGAGFCYIKYLADWEENHMFEVMEKEFWLALMGNVTKETREILEGNLETFQASVLIGYLFDAMLVRDMQPTFSKFILREELPKWMQYRIPPLRGDNSASSGR